MSQSAFSWRAWQSCKNCTCLQGLLKQINLKPLNDVCLDDFNRVDKLKLIK